ncbi:VOC family protein [Glycomyces sp. L485]|uniref:VOC family protein n=1 Tax=Glycomyces sp. L485 TaxID=2909235 RepID=UPI001F4B2AB5|nr:VOC family protein [Glycomyces sp. L485]MCH7230896.1 VOC family protein [Glycomyces sp. L485]
MTDVQPIPAGYPRVTPYLFVDGAADAIEFYKTVLAADEKARMDGPDGKVGHAELKIGESLIMVADEFPEMGSRSPKSVGGTPVAIHVYVEDVDSVFASALASGAKQLSEVTDEFYGDRTGGFEDPWGHSWYVATHVEDVPPAEMEKRAAEAMSGMR